MLKHCRPDILTRGTSEHITPGGALCVIGVPLDEMLVRCGDSAPSMGINLFDHLSDLMNGTGEMGCCQPGTASF